MTEAADAFQSLIERVTLTPSLKCGQVEEKLHGEFGTLLDWA